MAEKKKPFDLGDALTGILGSVSGSDTGREQICYLDINVLDADKENFYSMDGLEELAANIELVGLQQPLRVRENPGMPGRYLIVSGHRRRAALWTLYQEEPERWGAVPCIVEPAAASEELQQLRLIYANAGTRQMSSADLSRQAEQVEQLLYKLKEQGYEFPGRMRDHVAEACRVSKTKLATLKVIREKLIPELRQLWEAGALNETCAYRLAQAPEAQQVRLTEIFPEAELRNVPEWRIENWFQTLQGVSLIRCPDDGAECSNIPAREERAVRHMDPCKSRCCMDCWDLYCCEVCCNKAQAKREQQAAEREAREAENAAIRARAREEDEKKRQEEVEAGRAAWARFGKAATAAGISAREIAAYMEGEEPEDVDDATVKETEQRLAGTFQIPSGKREWDMLTYNDPRNSIDDYEGAIALADLLHCSTDYLLGRSPELTPAPVASAAQPLQFRSGNPDHDCRAWCVFDVDGEAIEMDAKWETCKVGWGYPASGAGIPFRCLGWYELPKWEEAEP